MSKKLIQAAAGAASGEPVYVEDVFSTYLYQGTGSTQSIDNGIDLDGEGGLVWIKNRDQSDFHILVDTERGTGNRLSTNSTGGINLDADTVTAFNSNGFTIGTDVKVNTNTESYVSWTFEKAAGFFDCVSWTGDGTSGRSISHNLGSTPGFIIIKRTNSGSNWLCYHRSLGIGQRIVLQSTAAAASDTNISAVSDSSFTVGNGVLVNNSGDTYVAYVFAHDDQSFGDNNNEAIIKCGTFNLPSYTDVSVSVGFEPQWVLVKNTSTLDDWRLIDVMRGAPMKGENSAVLRPNLSNAEAATIANQMQPQPDGFIWTGSSGWGYTGDHIYIAIRRPMKTPEAGTDVFAIDTGDNDGGGVSHEAGFVTDLIIQNEASAVRDKEVATRLTGSKYLETNNTGPEQTSSPAYTWDNQIGVQFSYDSAIYGWMFKRATGFMDVVAYSGTGSAQAVNHNLGAVPELMFIKARNTTQNWLVYPNDENEYLLLNTSGAQGAYSFFDSTAPTSTQFTIGSAWSGSGDIYIAYLFATLAGISKVGSYTGTAANLDVDCGFTAGARFILIKRTDSTGDWYVYDSVRGIVAGNDPYLLLNSTAAQTTGTDYIDPLNAGFSVTSSAPAGLNASGGSYIFLAIA